MDAPTDSYDCHGWTFTGGSDWINDDQVQQILNDNGYQSVELGAVLVGDLVIYRHEGNITHSGVVTEVDENGMPILIESKWGRLGRYLHAPDRVPPNYGQPQYYHTARGSHQLAHTDFAAALLLLRLLLQLLTWVTVIVY